MTQINFDSKNFKIDYLSFNLQFNNLQQIEEIAKYLADSFHCRSTLFDQSSKKQYILTENNKNPYSAEFDNFEEYSINNEFYDSIKKSFSKRKKL